MCEWGFIRRQSRKDDFMSVIEGKKDLIIFRARFVQSTLFEEVIVVLFKNIPSWILLMALASGCQVTPTANTEDVKNTNLTVGLVQQNINVGTSASDVLRVLGSPNIVKKSKNQGEVWVYDKFSTEQISQSVSGALVLLTPAVGPGAVGGGSSRTTSSTSTLTIILTFDENDLVQDVAYHSSRY